MSTPQLLALGALAGFTIFLGLPIGRIRTTDTRLKAALSAAATGILLFLLIEVTEHGVGPVEEALEGAVDDGKSWARFCRARRTVRDGCKRRPDEPRLLRPVDRAAAQQGDARAGCGLGRRVRAVLGRQPLAGALACAADRDRDRPAQLLRGPGHRAVRGAERGGARPRADHRLRAPQCDGRLRNRRSAQRCGGARPRGASSACSG